MSKGRHVPIRTCIACRSARPKEALIRIARTPEGGLVVDEGARMPGRGAYVCRDARCVEKVVSSARARSALGQSPSPEQAARLAALAADTGACQG